MAIQQAQRDADARIAAINRQADTRIAEIPSGAQGSQPAAVAETEPRRAETPAIRRDDAAALTTLRQAESMATSGDREAARELYVRVAANPNAPREVLGEAGTGLYRIGAWRESADAFRRLGTFARGEEDLRYYFAVALYESGDYREAQRELACALPFIQRTEDVERYRLRIEQTMAVNLTRR